MNTIKWLLRKEREINTIICGLSSAAVALINKWGLIYILIPIAFLLLHVSLLLMKFDKSFPVVKSLSFWFYIFSFFLGGLLYDFLKEAGSQPRIACFIVWIVPMLWIIFDIYNPVQSISADVKK